MSYKICAAIGSLRFIPISSLFLFLGLAENGMAQGIAAQYPCDNGIANHPSVIFTENFEENTLTQMSARWNETVYQAGMSFSTDKPTASGGAKSVRMSTIRGSYESAHLYMNLRARPGAPTNNGYDTLYFRYYTKLPAAFPGGGHQVGVGGVNPPSNGQIGNAGFKPSGSYRFVTGVDPYFNTHWDFYTYWMNMRCWGNPNGQCHGNAFNPSPTVPIVYDTWMGIEIMVKMNNPVTAFNGEQAFWIDGQKKHHLGPGFPNGTWSSDNFRPQAGGQPFEGFQWRSDPALNINYITLQYFMNNGDPGNTSWIWFDDVVVATEYIGPLAPCSGSDTSPPAAVTNLTVN